MTIDRLRKKGDVQPLIFVTSDDGIESKGLWAAIEALLPLGELLIVAPDKQWSGAGRSMPAHITWQTQDIIRHIDGQQIIAYAIDASPALAVQYAILKLAKRPPSLVVSGINFGLNVGNEVMASGTVGAAFEASAFGIPALAISLEMSPKYHLTGNYSVDYTVAMSYTRWIAQYQLVHKPIHDVDVLNINIPSDATISVPWFFTSLSRQRYFEQNEPGWAEGQNLTLIDFGKVEKGSDIWILRTDRAVSITPLSLDLTSRIDLAAMYPDFCAGLDN